MNPRTKEHLTTAMEAEAYSSLKCSRFAAHARMHDNHHLARIFQDAADADRCEHFERVFTSADLLGDVESNLRAAVDEKLHQIAMYSLFQKEAVSDGDNQAAAIFGSILGDELKQLEGFQLSIKTLKEQMPETMYSSNLRRDS